MTTALIALAGVLLTRRTSERQFAQRQELDREQFAQAQEVTQAHLAQSHQLERIEGMRKRYTTCAEQLAHASPAVRQAGVYALAALADDWNAVLDPASSTTVGGRRLLHEEARVCVDLLCAYLRSSTAEEDEEVRQSIASVIQRHAHGWSIYRYDLRRADLSGANLTYVALHYADLSDANLSGAILTRANLTRATLRGANLTGGYLGGANLTMADLSGTDLSGADLNRADLTSANLTDIVFGNRPRWPDGFTPPSSSSVPTE